MKRLGSLGLVIPCTVCLLMLVDNNAGVDLLRLQHRMGLSPRARAQLFLRGGSHEVPRSTLEFCGPNPRDEFDIDENTDNKPLPEFVHVPGDIATVPQAVEVSTHLRQHHSILEHPSTQQSSRDR